MMTMEVGVMITLRRLRCENSLEFVNFLLVVVAENELIVFWKFNGDGVCVRLLISGERSDSAIDPNVSLQLLDLIVQLSVLVDFLLVSLQHDLEFFAWKSLE
jgi:hypothetical protein